MRRVDDLTPTPHTAPCECGRGDKTGYKLGERIWWGRCGACDAEAKHAEEQERLAKIEADRRDRQEARTTKVHENLARIGVNRKYQAVTLGSFRGEDDLHALRAAQEFTKDFLNGDRPSLYLFSERPGELLAPGCGKTHLAVGILHALALNPDVPLADLDFVFVPKLLLEMQDTFKSADKSELDIVEKYAEPELLVWDDFGAEKLSDYAARTLYTILYEREGKSNVFTSNLSLGEIEGRDPSGYTQRITSRIAGSSRVVRMTGPDRRLSPVAA